MCLLVVLLGHLLKDRRTEVNLAMLVISRVLMIPLPYMVKELLLVVIARVADANNPNLQMRVLLLVQLLQMEIWALQVLQLDLELLCRLGGTERP